MVHFDVWKIQKLPNYWVSRYFCKITKIIYQNLWISGVNSTCTNF